MNPHQHPMHSWIEGEDQHGVFRGSVSDQSPAPQLPSQRPTNASEPLPIPIQQQRYLIYQSSAPVLHASSTHRHVSHHGHHPLHQPHFIHPQHPQHPQQQQFHQHQQLQQQQHHTDQQQHNLVLHPNDPFLQQVQQQHQSTQEHYRHPQDVQQLRHWLLQHSPQEHPPRHVHGAVRPIERADQGLLQYHHQDQGQYPQQQRLHASDHDAAKEYNQEGNMQNVLSRAHNVHPSFVLPTLSTSPSFSHPEGPTSLPRSLFAPLIPVFVPDASSPSSLTYRRIRSRTLSSIPTSSLPSTSSFYHPQTVTAAPALAALPAFSGDAHSSAQYYPHHTPDPDSIPRRKRGRGSHPAGFGMGGSSSINSLDIAWTTTAGHSQSHPIDIRSMTALPSSLPNLSPLVDWISEDSGGGNQSQYQPQLQQPTLEEQPPLHYKQQPPRHDPSHGALSAPRHDNMSPILIPKTYAPNKRPFVLSPPATRTTFSAEDRSWQRPHPNLSVLQEHQRQQKHELALHQLQGSRQHEGQQEHDRSSARERLSDNNVRTQPAPSPVSRIPPPTPMPRSTTTTTSTSTTHSIPMPHFRAQLMQQRTGDASYMRRFYAATPASSLPSLNPTSLDPSTSVPSHPSSRKAAAVRQRPSNEHMASENATRAGSGASQDVPGAIGIQLGRLLISTKQHVRGLLDSLILSDSRDVDPNLERVLLELLNGMLRSHCAFATRDNISSQEQPLNFRPTMLRSLAHLRELLSTTTTTTTAAAAVGNSPSSSTSNPSRSSGVQARLEGQHLTATRQRSSPLPPSRLSKSTLFPEGVDMEDEDMDTDLETAQFQSGSTVPSSTTTSELPGLDDERATEMYHSTVEFLALMTAFVSVVCWLLQTLRDNPQGLSGRTDASTSESSFREHGLGRRDEKAGGRGGGINMTNETSRSQDNTLRAFLDLFDDRDNVLKPISDALTRDEHHHSRKNDEDIGQDPMAQVGLFAWHFYMFASDPEGPLIRDGQAISAKTLHTIHLDVILNELYTTHVLSMTVKEHQKDHGQFYTPPGVVDFMWKRTIKGYGNLLDRFVESLTSGHDNTQQQQQQHQGLSISLIPIALDPCLGVSTFLSCYVRLLIQEAQLVHGDIIWNSERAARRLLGQICDHVWGIELDGFAFWMARCGILAALMPLVQRVQELALASELSYGNQYMATTRTTISPLKLPPLHLFRNDTLQLTLPDGNTPEAIWERDCIMQLRNPARLQFDFIVTNPPYMIRKTGTFSAPDPQVYDWNILGSSFATNAGVASSSSTSSGLPRGSKSKLTKKKNPDYQGQVVSMEEGSVSAVDTCDEGANESESEVATPDSSVSAGSAASMSLRPERSSPSPQPSRPGAKGMMQAYGYFIWFAAQRIKPYTGVACTITASQWLTLEFAAKLRAWLFENCLLDEFFQFEPFKVFSKVQTDSLIFKIRALDPSSTDPSSREHALQDHSTVFLRHTDHHKSLTGILQDYMDYPIANSQCVGNDLSIMASSKSRQELSAAILAPPPSLAPSAAGSAASTSSTTSATTTTWTYSFAPMMPSSGLTTYLLTLAQDLGGICSAGTKKVNRLSAAEPLLWHRGPNTNPVYGLVVRMEYARVNFGEIMTDRWFRPALYWNGKNSPEESAPGASIHKEGLFWQGRDRLRLSKKEGSPAESYLVPTPDPQRLYALCMMDKESVKVLRQQVEQGTEGASALWKYLTDVRNHFQPGLLASRKRKVTSSGKQQGVDDDGVAYCSTNQCGSEVPEKIVHPINYGYFSKTQPRQRFFLDTNSLAVTNQCIYLTLNVLSHHYDAQQSPPLIYFLTLLNSSTLQFFVLHHCQYDQQGRMRLFRESMAKIPFQDRDVKHNPERTRYASQLGEVMIELKGLLYQVVTSWHLTGAYHHHGGGLHGGTATGRRRSVTAASAMRGATSRQGEHFVGAGSAGSGINISGGVGGNQSLMDWIRKGGDAPVGMMTRIKEQVRRMLMTVGTTVTPPLMYTPTMSQSSSLSSITRAARVDAFMADMTDTDTNSVTDTDTDTDDNSQTELWVLPSTTQERFTENPLSWASHQGNGGGSSFESTVTGQIAAARGDVSQGQLYRHLHMSFDQGDIHDPNAFQFQRGITTNAENRAVYDNTLPSSAQFHRPSFTAIPKSLPQTTPSTSSSSPLHYSAAGSELSTECDKIVQAIERAIAMVEMAQWAVDQYGYMLYGIRPKFQKLLELELKLVYGSVIESLVAPSSPATGVVSTTRSTGSEAGISSMPGVSAPWSEYQQQRQEQGPHLTDNAASRLGISVSELHRWDGDDGSVNADNGDSATASDTSSLPVGGPASSGVQQCHQEDSSTLRQPANIPTYAPSILENAQAAAQLLRELLQKYRPGSSLPLERL